MEEAHDFWGEMGKILDLVCVPVKSPQKLTIDKRVLLESEMPVGAAG